MSNQFVVDSFTIELGFSEKVMAGLQRVEKRVLPLAERIEKKLNNAFRVDAGKITQPGINRMVKNVERAGKQINRTLTNAFKIDNLGRGSIRSFETEGVQSARRVAREMQRAFSATRTSLPASPNRPGRRPRPTAGDVLARNQERISELHQRQTTSAQYGNMLLRTPQRAEEYRTRLNTLRDQHAASGDFAQFRSGLRSLNFEFAQGARAASQARAAQRLAAMEATTGLGGLTSAAGGVVAAFLTAQKAVQFFADSVQEGIKRTQAQTMLSTAFGADTQAIKTAVDTYADKYGADKATAQEQAAQLRMTLPEAQFSNQQIPQPLETESVFAHQTGMGQEQVGRFNYALQQIASSAKLMGQDWLQVVNASPALIKPLQELTGTKDTRALRDKLKTMSGAEVAKAMIQAMENLNNKSGAAAKAQDNVAASLGRLSNAEKDAQEAFFNGFNGGFKNLLNSLTMNLKDSQGTMTTLGKVLGSVFNRIASLVYLFDEVSSNIRGALTLMQFEFKDFYNGLDKDTRDKLDELGKVVKSGLSHIVELALGIFGVKAVGGVGRLAAGAAERGAGAVGASGLARAAGFLRVGIVAMERGVIAMFVAALLNHKIDDVQEKAKAANMTTGEYIMHMKQEREKNKKPLFDYDNWQWVKDVKGRWKETLNAPLAPQWGNNGLAAANVPQIVQVHTYVHFDGQLQNTLDARALNDIMMKPVDVKDLIAGHHEDVMTTATGLSGGWQQHGQNAGFRPSMLTRPQQVAQ